MGQRISKMLAPEVALVGLGTQSYVDRAYVDVYPHLRQIVDLTCRQTDDPFNRAGGGDFLAPHGLSVPMPRV